ncbi:MAG TPA: preprotein translocase subunit SecY, partial [Candidatus Methylomirabilis sp.]
MIEQVRNIFRVPELKRRVLFTCALLIVYRIGAHVPTPGIDAHALALFFQQQGGNLLGFFDRFSVGALRR